MKDTYGKRIGVLLLGSLFCLAAPATASTINLGLFSFDSFIGGGGTNAFAVENFTGTSFLPDDFPITDAVVFEQLRLTLDDGLGQGLQIFDIADIGPGNSSTATGAPPVSLQFPDTITFVSALLEGQFAASPYALGGSQSGLLFTPGSTFFSVSLIAGASGVLELGDVQAITVDGTLQQAPASAVPEPGSLLLLGTGLGAVLRARRKRRAVTIPCVARQAESVGRPLNLPGLR